MRGIVYILVFTISALIATSASAQCLVDRHNTSVNDGWISCSKTANPNPANGESHWILYEFDSATNIYKTRVWNVNQRDYLLWGAKEIKVEYALDFGNWSSAGNYTIIKGTGSSTYLGSAGPDLQGVTAKYLLITILETYGGSCAGFGEWKFYTEPANTNALTLDLRVCENDDVIKHINGGMNAGGTYSGTGVVNNYDDSFDFDPQLAGAGAHTITYTYPGGVSTTEINVQLCTEANCPPCPLCTENPQADYDAVPVNPNTYYDEEISSSGTIAPNTIVNFYGSNFVDMKEDFTVEPGAEFLATIRTCEENQNLLANPSFDTEVPPWFINTYGPADGSLARSTTIYYNGEGAALVSLTSPDETDWHVQLEQAGLTIEANTTYSVSFAARASSAFSGWCSLQLNQDPWTGFGGQTIHYTTEWQQFSFDIETSQSSPPNAVGFTLNIGAVSPNVVYFDNFVLTKNE